MKKASIALAAAAFAATAHAQSFEGCVPASEGTPFTVKAGATDVKGVAMGRGNRAVVFSNTAYNAPCDWLAVARELVAKGYQVALWSYSSGGLEQIGELAAVVDEIRRRGAAKVVLVGGSRGGCLSMMASSELKPPVQGVAILSCAAVFNRRSPTPTAPYVAKVKAPLLHITGELDSVPTLDEAREEFKAYPVADKKLLVVPQTGAHGDQLLTTPNAAPTAKPELLDFIDRVSR
jgi:pimeloyl-ACP methyl ester carboxylesterase